jgi:hypothetical protein
MRFPSIFNFLLGLITLVAEATRDECSQKKNKALILFQGTYVAAGWLCRSGRNIPDCHD